MPCAVDRHVASLALGQRRDGELLHEAGERRRASASSDRVDAVRRVELSRLAAIASRTTDERAVRRRPRRPPAIVRSRGADAGVLQHRHQRVALHARRRVVGQAAGCSGPRPPAAASGRLVIDCRRRDRSTGASRSTRLRPRARPRDAAASTAGSTSVGSMPSQPASVADVALRQRAVADAGHDRRGRPERGDAALDRLEVVPVEGRA